MMCKLHLLINTRSDGFSTTQQPQLLLQLNYTYRYIYSTPASWRSR